MLLIATTDGLLAGHVGIVAEPDGTAEMKRLYVRPYARGLGLGERLVRAALTTAAGLGCHTMKLVTVPGLMDSAIALYYRLGFQPMPRFGDLPLDNLLYLERCIEPLDEAAARALGAAPGQGATLPSARCRVPSSPVPATVRENGGR